MTFPQDRPLEGGDGTTKEADTTRAVIDTNSGLQHWFNLSDPGAEDALYESPARRGFPGADLGRMAAPDETTILHFRHLLETQDLCGGILDAVNSCLGRQGIRISTGTIVATIAATPTSTKNSKQERDTQMHPPGKVTSIILTPKRTSASNPREALCTRCVLRLLRCVTSI